MKYNIWLLLSLNNCLTIFSFCWRCQKWDHLHWSFVCLEWFISQPRASRSSQVKLLLLRGAPFPSLAGAVPGWSSKEQGINPACVRSQRIARESGAACSAWAHMGWAAAFTFPLGLGSDVDALFPALLQNLCGTGRVEWTFLSDYWSNALSDNYLHYMLFLKYIYRFLSTFQFPF